MKWMMGKIVIALFFVSFMCVPVQCLGTIEQEGLNSSREVDTFLTALTYAEQNTVGLLGFGPQRDGWNSSSWGTEEDGLETMESKHSLVAASLSTEQAPAEKSETFNGQLHRLVRKGDLDGAYELISKGLEEVSRDDPNFFFLNLYAGEILVQKRNMLIHQLVNRLGKQEDISELKACGTEFNRDLSRHKKPNKEALRHLLTAWQHIYLVSEKDHQTAVTRLTDAFYGLVRPYISYTLFRTNSDRILNTCLPSLDTACALLNQIPIGKVHLEGHTDDRGPAEDNLALSKRRAASVKDYLLSKGIREDLITANGKGETSPIASNNTYEGRAKNRRVEIVLSIRFQTP